jgi:hypothetical protein
METHDESRPLPVMSRVLRRVLDPRKHLDYAWLALLAAVPIAVSYAIGAYENSPGGFIGYRNAGIWPWHVVLLPASALLLRQLMDRMAPVSEDWPPQHVPAIVGLVETDAGKRSVYAGLRGALLSPRNLAAALLITLAANIADTANLARVFLAEPGSVKTIEQETGPPRLEVELSAEKRVESEADWSTMFVDEQWVVGGGRWGVVDGRPGVGKWACLWLNVSAYTVQFSLLLLAILLTILLLRHNLFFLFRIYQRRWVPEGEEQAYLHIDLDDEEGCFGFRRANDAFNAQILITAVAAAFLLGSRIHNVGLEMDLFPDVGQTLSVLGLAAAIAIVSLPIAVKLLPLLRPGGRDRASVSLVGYLREFLSDDAWDVAKEPVEAVAARFARNAFWPTGNNRARPIFFCAFWAFFVVWVPDPRALSPILDIGEGSRWAGFAVSGVLALAATWALFAFLKGMLSYVDPRLVEAPEHPIARSPRAVPIQASVFLSYRRDDTAAYAGRLRDGLQERLGSGHIFMDIATVELGADFVQAIEAAITSTQLMIVLIGPRWLTLTGADGRPRIESRDDVVHQEIALGLASGIQVLPILVGGARMPSAAELPEPLEKLARHNAHELSDTRWVYDVGVLLEHLAKLSAAQKPAATG